MSQQNFSNEALNKLSIHKDKTCCYCGRKYPKTILNIEAGIHHRSEYKCLNLKECNRVRRKNKRRNQL